MSGSLVWLALIATVAGNVDLANNELQLENLLQVYQIVLIDKNVMKRGGGACKTFMK